MQKIPPEKCILILNKIDLLKDGEILAAIRYWSENFCKRSSSL